MYKKLSSIKLAWLLGALMVFLGAALLLSSAPTAKVAVAAPSFGCDVNGYLFKYPSGPTQIHTVDMVTGQDQFAAEIFGREINAVGYNPKDNNFYGWDNANSTFVRVSGDFSSATPLTISGYGGPVTGIIIGDVDDNGHYWHLSGNTWYQTDLTTPTPTLVAPPGTPVSNPTGTAGADWAFIPDTNSLYRTMDNGTDVTVWAFNRTSKTWSNVGTVPEISAAADRVIGANYADPEGNLYASSNGSGKVWRIDVDASPLAAVHIGTGNPSSSNDGARCALASVPTDFGDAPSGYSTLIDDDGPRHNVVGFDVINSNAPMMLGKKVDIENDGFPSSDAAGDDDDHEGLAGSAFVDDERGVAHIIATPGSSAPLTVPVYVANGSSVAATLVGWIDLDNDSSFEAVERVTVNIPAGFSGYQELTFPSPAAPYSVNTFARFRLFDSTDTSAAATGLLPTGSASGGEVEDVLVQVGSFTANKTASPPEGTTVKSGETVTYTLNIQNTGATNLVNLKIDDDLTDVLDDSTLEGTPTVSPASAGTATVTGNTLEFAGDIAPGQTVTVTYTVKVEFLGSLANAALGNTIIAAHSNCHPTVSGGTASVSDAACNTDHPVLGLAATGMSVPVVLSAAGGLITVSIVASVIIARRSPKTAAKP